MFYQQLFQFGDVWYMYVVWSVILLFEAVYCFGTITCKKICPLFWFQNNEQWTDKNRLLPNNHLIALFGLKKMLKALQNGIIQYPDLKTF